MLEQGELEILLGVQIVQKSDAETITEMIMDILLQLNIDTGIIIGLVCDITSTNSGHLSELAVQLQCKLGRKKLVELACRHHVS